MVRHWSAWLAGLAILVSASSASAQVEQTTTEGVGDSVPPPGATRGAGPGLGGGRYPVSYAKRPLTLYRGMLALDGEFAIAHVTVSSGGVTYGSSTTTLFAAGGSFGITDDLEVGALVLPILLSPDFKYGNPQIFGTYRFLRGDFEAGARAELILPVESGSKLEMLLSVPLLLRVGPTGRMDINPGLDFYFGDSTVVSLVVPFRFTINITEPLYLYVLSGLAMHDFKPKNTTIPLGGGVGYTIADAAHGPVADVGADFTPLFFIPGSDGDKVTTDLWVLQFVARVYLNVL